MALHTSTIRPNLFEVSTCSHLQAYLVLYLPTERKKCRVVRSSISSLAQVVQYPPKSCALTCFPKKYSPSLYFPLMYISPYRKGFCRPPDHSHLKLGTMDLKKNRIHPLPSKPLLHHHHHQNKQHLISPRHSALSSVYKKRKKEKKTPPWKYFHARSVMYRRYLGKRSSNLFTSLARRKIVKTEQRGGERKRSW